MAASYVGVLTKYFQPAATNTGVKPCEAESEPAISKPVGEEDTAEEGNTRAPFTA